MSLAALQEHHPEAGLFLAREDLGHRPAMAELHLDELYSAQQLQPLTDPVQVFDFDFRQLPGAEGRHVTRQVRHQQRMWTIGCRLTPAGLASSEKLAQSWPASCSLKL